LFFIGDSAPPDFLLVQRPIPAGFDVDGLAGFGTSRELVTILSVGLLGVGTIVVCGAVGVVVVFAVGG